MSKGPALERQYFDALIGSGLMNLIAEKAPSKVRNRVFKALEHYGKSHKLMGIDDDMGLIRLIAGEEELVVAIFEWLKLHEEKFPAYRDFIKYFKNHPVKLTFHPVLAQLRFIVENYQDGKYLRTGLPKNRFDLVFENGTVSGRMLTQEGVVIAIFQPFAFEIGDLELDAEQQIEAFYDELEYQVKSQLDKSVKEFITARSDFRNKLLYSSDGGQLGVDEPLEHYIDEVFPDIYRDLLWCIGALLSDHPKSKEKGIVSQFIGFYRYVLVKNGLIKNVLAANSATD